MVGTITSKTVKKSGTVIGEAVLVTKAGDVVFVKAKESYKTKKGDTLLSFDRTRVLPRYLYYYLQNLRRVSPEDFTAIYK